jgi:regulator of replication initiation timing
MALSGAERQRRYMARLKATVTDDAATKAVTDEFVRLKAFARQIEGENAALKEKLATVTDDAARLQAENKSLKEKLAAAERRADLLSRFTPRGAAMTASQFNIIRKCVHPDTVARFKDDKLTSQFNEAAKLLNSLRPQLTKA